MDRVSIQHKQKCYFKWISKPHTAHCCASCYMSLSTPSFILYFFTPELYLIYIIYYIYIIYPGPGQQPDTAIISGVQVSSTVSFPPGQFPVIQPHFSVTDDTIALETSEIYKFSFISSTPSQGIKLAVLLLTYPSSHLLHKP